MKAIASHILLCIMLVVAGGCRHTSARHAASLAAADSLAACSEGEAALQLLQDIPPEELSRGDRALHALLTVKAADKAFNTHTSDSAIRIALDYFGSHGQKLRRAEALYYKGRVFSDLNDYAPALDTYDDALTLLGRASKSVTDTASLRLRSVILSQNAQLLEDIRLYPEAIPFYSAASDISLDLGDSIDAFLDLDQIIFDYIQLDSIDRAEVAFNRILTLKPAFNPERMANLETTRRYILLKKGNLKEAVSGIDSVISYRSPRFRNFVLMVATEAYQMLGMRDSADFYASILINQEFESNKTTAYHNVLQNRLFASGDSLSLRLLHSLDSLNNRRIDNYRHAPEIIGKEFLKYRMEQKDSQRLRSKNQTLIITVGIAIISLLGILTVYLVNRGRLIRRNLQQERKEKLLLAQKLRLEQSNAYLTEKNQVLAKLNSDLKEQTVRKLSFECSREALIDDIIHNYTLISKNHGKTIPVSSAISNSDVCKRIRMRKSILPADKIWSELNSLLCAEAPLFINTILHLHSGSKDVLHIIMLIRAGFRPNEIAQLLSRSKNTISSHRSTICENFFMGKITIADLDDVIRSISAH